MKARDMVGLLKRSMYGCQDASNLWQSDYTHLLASGSYRAGLSAPPRLYLAGAKGPAAARAVAGAGRRQQHAGTAAAARRLAVQPLAPRLCPQEADLPRRALALRLPQHAPAGALRER